MTTHTLPFYYVTGQTLTAKIFTSVDALEDEASLVVEETNRKQQYVATFEDVAAGDYMLVYFVAGSAVGYELARFTGEDGEEGILLPNLSVPTVAQLNARTLVAAEYATATAQTTLAAIFTGITSLADWIRRIARKDAGSAGMVTAGTEINTGGTATFAGTTDSLEAVRDAVTANLSAIQGSEVIQVASPNVSGNLVLTQGDTYDGIGNPKAQWTVSTDYTDGWAVTLTIRDVDDAVVYTVAGTVASTTLVEVAIAAQTGLTMEGCPGQWQGKFDVQLTKSGSVVTIALGTCYINEDQTR